MVEINKFDIIVPIAKSDINALLNILPYIKKQLPDAEIKIIANSAVKDMLNDISGVTFIDENTMLPGMDFGIVKKIIGTRYPKAERRTGWYFQQFLKLGYARICNKEYFLTWDSDTLPLTGISFFSGVGKPFLDVLPSVAEDAAYNVTIGKLWTDGSVKKHHNVSYISEHMMFKTSIVKEMLDEIENNNRLEGATFYEKILNAVPISELNLSGFSEFETYAAYVTSKEPELYDMRKWKNLRHGKVYFGGQPSQAQLDWVAKKFDVISLEDFDHQWGICKWICKDSNLHRWTFEQVYHVIEPCVEKIYKIRMIVRKYVRK